MLTTYNHSRDRSAVIQAFRRSEAQTSAEFAQAERSMALVQDSAHRLKSGARSIGATRLAGICAQIEQSADELGSDHLDDLLASFHSESRTIVAYLAARP
jgi:HPt (histidine-containing phosphotransfer) domain-containing protein